MSAVTAFAGRGLSVVLALLTVPLTLNYLGTERYGMWVTISSLIALLSFTDLGIGYSLLNATTQALARHDLTAARRQVSSGVVMLIVLAAVLGTLMVLIVPAVHWADVFAVSSPIATSEAAPAVAVWLASFLIGLPLSAVAQLRFARQEGYLVHMTAAAGNLAGVAFLLVAIAMRQGLPVLVLAMAVPPLVTSALNGYALFTGPGRKLRPSVRLADHNTAMGLLRTGSLFFVLQFAIAVAFTSDTLVLSQVIGPTAVAEYGVTYRLFIIPAGIASVVLTPLWPAYGHAIAFGDIAWVRRTLVSSIRVSLAISVPAATFLVVLGLPIIVRWVGASVTPPFILIVGFGIWIIMSTVGNAVAMFLNGAGEIRLQAASAAIMAVINLGLSIWLTMHIGVAGVVWGTVIAYSGFVLVPMAVYVPKVLRRLVREGNAVGAGAFSATTTTLVSSQVVSDMQAVGGHPPI